MTTLKFTCECPYNSEEHKANCCNNTDVKQYRCYSKGHKKVLLCPNCVMALMDEIEEVEV